MTNLRLKEMKLTKTQKSHSKYNKKSGITPTLWLKNLYV